MAKAESGQKAPATPMMKQYALVKAKHPDKIVLFHLGDFYEMFNEDARKASHLLGLTLTSRQGIPMAGMPVHAAPNYIKKLLDAGEKAVICDQVEDAKQRDAPLLKRAVTRIITPGTVMEEELLDAGHNNFLLAIKPVDGDYHLAWADLSTGELFTATADALGLEDEITRISPREVLVSEENEMKLPAVSEDTETALPAYLFEEAQARVRLSDYFGVETLEGFGVGPKEPVGHIGALVAYIVETQKENAPALKPPHDIASHEHMILDANALHNLEILDDAGNRGKSGGLLSVLDATVTAIGKRMLRAWLTRPSAAIELLRRRHDVVGFLLNQPELSGEIRRELRNVQDLERLTGRIDAARATPRDVGAAGKSLAAIPRIKALILAASPPPALAELSASLEPLPELEARIASSLVDEPPVKHSEGGIFRDGSNPEVDRLRTLRNDARDWLARYRAAEIKRTGIKNLKVAYNRVFGYYIEISKANLSKVPEDYERRQTLTNSERYITPELKRHEEEVLSAEERLQSLEAALFEELRSFAKGFVTALRLNAAALGTLDVLTGFAEISRSRRYVRPRLVTEPVVKVKGGRHAVVEARIPAGEFVPNDTELVGASEQIIILTGPNMSGKSTYIRQVALVAVMAQVGCFVPADEAELGVFDRVFARVGASDDIVGGRSTFMVEMVETAVILHNATSRSLVVLDEVGRGTSTFDGLSLAWAIVEYLHENTRERPLVLFATHYHELTAMAQKFRRIRNFNVAVREWQNEVVFLHRIIPGGMDKSYGIHVARIAGVPEKVIGRAGKVLERLEEHAERLKDEALAGSSVGLRQLSLFVPIKSEVEKELASLDIERMAPVDAIKVLEALRTKALKNLGDVM